MREAHCRVAGGLETTKNMTNDVAGLSYDLLAVLADGVFNGQAGRTLLADMPPPDMPGLDDLYKLYAQGKV